MMSNLCSTHGNLHVSYYTDMVECLRMGQTAVYFYVWIHLYQKLKMHCYILHILQSQNIITNSQVHWDVLIPPFIQAEFPLILKKDI